MPNHSGATIGGSAGVRKPRNASGPDREPLAGFQLMSFMGSLIFRSQIWAQSARNARNDEIPQKWPSLEVRPMSRMSSSASVREPSLQKKGQDAFYPQKGPDAFSAVAAEPVGQVAGGVVSVNQCTAGAGQCPCAVAFCRVGQGEIVINEAA
jgi:hypothetical protein